MLTTRGLVSITLDLFATIETSDIQARTTISSRTWPRNVEKFSFVAPEGWEKVLGDVDPEKLKTVREGNILKLSNAKGSISIPLKPYRTLWVDKWQILDTIKQEILSDFMHIKDISCICDDEGIHTSEGIKVIPNFHVRGTINVENIKRLLLVMTHDKVSVTLGDDQLIFSGLIDGVIKGMGSISVKV
jgi:hypothetical protein